MNKTDWLLSLPAHDAGLVEYFIGVESDKAAKEAYKKGYEVGYEEGEKEGYNRGYDNAAEDYY